MRALSLLAGLVVAAAPVSAQQFPTTPPPPMPLEPAQFPPFAETILENGLRIIVVANHKQPVLSLTLAVPGGSFYDPAGKSGTAELVAGLLTKGAGARSAEQIASAIEGVGGSIAASAGADFLTLSTSVLVNDRRLAFELLADAALRPTFPANEIELLRTQTLSSLALAKSQPDAIAARTFAKGLFGDHPYGNSADEASVRAISREDLQLFHRQRVRPNQAILVIAGAIDTAEARQLGESSFAAWGGVAAGSPATRPAPQRAQREILLVHRPGSVQSNIIVGNTTWMATDPRGYALTIANQVLGGASDSRLFMILREQKGWTYGSYSNVTRRRGLGNFTATAEVRTEVTDSALVELLAQIRRVGTEPMPVEEFERQKQTLVGRFPLQIETAGQVASQVANARLLGLANDYVQTYRQRLAAVTPEQAQGAARVGMRADAALIVVVGDATKVGESLRAIGPVRMLDIDGNTIAASDLEVKAAALDLDRERMAAVSDSFSVLVQGNPFGYQVTSLDRDGDGWIFRERTMLGTFVQTSTEVRFGADISMRSANQRGTIQGQQIQLEVSYADGKASGRGTTPSPTGPQQVSYSAVDAPAGTLDDNVVMALLPYLRWAPDAQIELQVLASGKGVVERRQLRVTAEETLTIPAGTVETFRVGVSGGDQPGTYWIEKASPHRVMKFGPTGAPIEFVRVR